MHTSSLDLNLGQPSNNNNDNININNKNKNNSNISISTSSSNDNECIFNCSSNTQVLLISNNNNNNNTKTGRQMLAAQETKTAEENRENVRSANITNGGGEGESVIGRTPERDVESNEKGGILGSKPGVRSCILVDESASYENDDTGDTEQTLNPSDDINWDDEYEDDEEAEENEDDEEGIGTENGNDAYADEDTAEEETRVDVAAQARKSNGDYESLPEAKRLTQALVGDENESIKNMQSVSKAKTIAHIPSVSIVDTAAVRPNEEEEDMGFDEDDERIAIIVERQRGGHPHRTNDNDKGFMSEEGSGADTNRYNNNRFRLDYLDKYRKKQQRLHMEHANSRGGVNVAREGSGNFANDDDDDDDDDSDDDVDDKDDDDGDGVDDGVGDADANDDADRQEGDNYFNAKHQKSHNRYFRKNTNDAIKIISTPLGKVGIVYQQTPTDEDGSSNSKKQDTHTGDKKTSSFTDFDALSPDPESSHRLASSHPKITPVLTPDGKVALLYRGDSENSKYEPIRNLTHKFSNNNNKNDFTDNKASDTINKDAPDFQSNDGSEKESSADASEDDDDYDLDSDSNGNEGTNLRKTANPTDETQKAAIQNPATDADAATATGSSGSFIIRPTDSVLPMINRPLSEVLGIKKNQFKQIRIKDQPTLAPKAAASGGDGADSVGVAGGVGDPRSLAGTSIDRAIDTTTLHFLTKVNLAEYPTSMKTRNFDFDFSRDNTMLDERRRYKEHQLHQQQQQQQQQKQNGGNNNYESGDTSNNKLNEEVLAKTEVVNLAIIPHFDEELERLQRLRELETRRHYRQRYRQRPSEQDLSGIHCIMQAMMGIAAISTVFGMLGTFFKQRILDQIRLMHW